MAWFSAAIRDNELHGAGACVRPSETREKKKRGIETARLLLQHVEAVPVAAEILDLTGRELEPRAKLAVLEEDVCVAQARGVQVLPLALLRQDSLDALDEPDLFQNPDLAVARRDRDAVPLADLLGADLPLVRREEDLRAVFVGQELGCLEGGEKLRGPLEFGVVVQRSGVILHGSNPSCLCAVDAFLGYLSYRA